MKTNLNIVSAKIVGIKKSQVVCETETNEILLINKPQNDRLFSQIMVDLLRSGLWIPVNKKLKQFIQYDWLDNASQLAF